MMTVKSLKKSYKVHPREGTFHGKYIRHILQILIQGYAGSGLLALLDPESRGIKAEIFADLRKKVGEDSRLLRHLWVVASVHEDVVLSGVAMQITK